MKWLPLDCLFVDHNYQREATPKRSQKIAIKFQWRHFQPVTVAPTGDDKYAVLDGQHRIIAARIHPHIKEVPCYIVDAPEMETQAGTFVVVNRDRANIRPVDLYFAGLMANDEECLRVKAVLDDYGVRVLAGGSGQMPPMSTAAIACIKRCIGHSGEAATRKAIKALAEAHPETPGTFTAAAIFGVTSFFAIYRDVISDEKTVALLREVNFVEFAREITDHRRFKGGSLPSVARELLMKEYKALFGDKEIRAA